MCVILVVLQSLGTDSRGVVSRQASVEFFQSQIMNEESYSRDLSSDSVNAEDLVLESTTPIASSEEDLAHVQDFVSAARYLYDIIEEMPTGDIHLIAPYLKRNKNTFYNADTGVDQYNFVIREVRAGHDGYAKANDLPSSGVSLSLMTFTVHCELFCLEEEFFYYRLSDARSSTSPALHDDPKRWT